MNTKNRSRILRSLVIINGHCERIKNAIQSNIDRNTDKNNKEVTKEKTAEDERDKITIDELKKIVAGLHYEATTQNLHACAELLLEITVRNYTVIFKHIPYEKKSRNRIIELFQSMHFRISRSIE